MASTQDHLPFDDIRNDVVILKNGNMAVVLETSAVNFGLLSEQEQLAIISSFAGLLNSLSFPIQIVIRSKKLDITSYLKLLDKAQAEQTNPLLVKMIQSYRGFIESTIIDNEVLDKRFFIVVPMAFYEVGLIKNTDENFAKAMTLILPRRDHVIRQLARAGLTARQLTTEGLIRLFYDIYNPSDKDVMLPKQESSTVPIQAVQPVQQTVVVPQPAAGSSAPQSGASTPPPTAVNIQSPASNLQPPVPDVPPEPLHPIQMNPPVQAPAQPTPVVVQPSPPVILEGSRPVGRPIGSNQGSIAPLQNDNKAIASSPNNNVQPAQRAPARGNGLFIVEELPDQYGTA